MATDLKPDPAKDKLAGFERASRGPVAIAGAVTAFASLLWIAQAWFAAGLIGGLVENSATQSAILLQAGLFAVTGIIRHGLELIAGRRAFAAATKLVARERQCIVERESLASPLMASDRSSAGLATLIGTKLDLLIPWITRYRIATIKVAFVPVIIVVAVALQSWAAAIILLVSGPLIPLFMVLIGFAAREASEEHMAETGTLNSLLLEWLNAGADIKLLNAEKTTVSRFEEAADALRLRTMSVLRIAFMSSTVLELFAALGIALAAVYVGFSLLGTFSFGAYSTPLSVAGGIFILLLVPDFFLPLRELAAAWHDRAAALAVAGEIAALEAACLPTIIGNGGKARPLTGPAELQTRGLCIRLGESGVLNFPDMEIAAGEKIAITGQSGAGKSTFLGLLAGLARADGGSIRTAGVELGDGTADAWRARIGLIGQQPHILNASLQTNITLDAQSRETGTLQSALEAASASQIIVRLPAGMHTRLGENGAGVSGGEARRLMIARTLFSGADVILADEPTADLDRQTARKVTEALLSAAANGATLIVATHDPALAAQMDREIRLEAHP